MLSFGIVPVLLLLGSAISRVTAQTDAATAAVATDAAVSSTSSSVTATFSNSVQYQFDTDGNAIDLTSGNVEWLGGAYVWYGLTYGCGKVFCGVASYSSPDLTTWHYNGYLFDPDTAEIQAFCSPPLSGNCGRPHIVYSTANNQYVLWLNQNSPGYAIFTSSSPTSGYVQSADRALVGFQPPGPFMAGDLTVQTISETGYIVYSLIDFTTTGASIWPPFNQSLYVQQLTPDMKNTTGSAYHVVTPALDYVDYEAESPDIFKRGDYFYITASNTCGWCTGTLLTVYRSKALAGPWTRQIISADTCGGQTEGVISLPSPSGGATSYLQVADLFRTAPITGTRTASHGHQFQLLQFNPDGSVKDLDCTLSKTASVTIKKGSAPSTGLAISATDGSGESTSIPYSVSCNLPQYQLYQTWASSKAGNLAEVGVNIGSAAPTDNLTITIFRYQNNTNFFTPHYVWETLSTFNLVPANTSQALEVVRVPVNSAVKKGDKLGIALVTLSITPQCTLVRNTSTTYDVTKSTTTLFGIGANQVSYRGKTGTTPPTQVFDGQEIKWYAIVN